MIHRRVFGLGIKSLRGRSDDTRQPVFGGRQVGFRPHVDFNPSVVVDDLFVGCDNEFVRHVDAGRKHIVVHTATNVSDILAEVDADRDQRTGRRHVVRKAQQDVLFACLFGAELVGVAVLDKTGRHRVE